MNRDFFHQAAARTYDLAHLVVSEFQMQVENQVKQALEANSQSSQLNTAAFLQHSSSEQVDLRVVSPAITYPTMYSMVEDMEMRNDMAGNLSRQKAVVENLKFLQAANAAAKENLEHAIQSALRCL